MHYPDPLLEPEGMDPLIESAMDRANYLLTVSTEGRHEVNLKPMIQIVVRGLANVIVGVNSFPHPDDLIPSCMNAIKASEETEARAAGYIFATTSEYLSPVEFEIPIRVPSIVVLGVDRNSWGKVIVSSLDRCDQNLLTIQEVVEYEGYGMFSDTIYDPWSPTE